MACASQTVLQSLVEIAADLCQAGTAGISLLETTDGGEAIFRSTVLAGTLAPREIATPRNFSPDGVCLDRAAPQLFSHPDRYFTYIQALDTPIVECLILPLIAGSQTLGTIWIASHDEHRHFDSEDLRVMATLADFTSTALQLDRPQTEQLVAPHARSQVQTAQSQQIPASVPESETYFRAIANLVPDMLWRNDATGDTSWYNQRWLDYTGQTLQEAQGYGWLEAIHPDDRAQSLANFQKAVGERRPLQQELRIRGRDGNYRWFQAKAEPVFDAGGQIIWFGAASDIHDRRMGLQALQESEKRLLESAAMLERAERVGGLGHWTYDIVTKEMFWSPQARRIYVGECDFELSYEAAASLVHPDDLAELLAATDEAIAQKRSLEAEYRIIRPDRSQATVCLSADLDFDAAGQPVKMFGIVQDITDRQRIEAERLRSHEALRESEERWRATVENLPAGAVFVVDRNLRYLLAGGEALSAGGLEPEDIVGRRVSEMLPPELVADCEAEYRRALAGESFDREHTVRDRWYISRGTPLRSASGEVYAVLAVSYDITDRKRAEAALRDSEEKYRTLVCANSKMVWATDADGNIVEEVPGWESFTGQTFDEYKNFGWLRALHPDDAERIGQIWQSSIAQHATAIGEYRLRSRSGDYRRFAVRGEPLLEADGKLRGWVGTIVDVEEMRRAAAAEQAALDRLRESEAKYRSLFESMDEGYVLVEVIFDADDRPIDILYIDANPAAVRMTGTELAGKTTRELDPNLESQWFETFGRVAKTGIAERHEFHTALLDAWYNFYAFKVGEPNETRVAAVYQDVTDRKRAEGDRKRAEAQLRRTAEMDAFRVELADALGSLTDPVEIQRVAMRVVGEWLSVDRVLYCEIDGDAVTIADNYVRGNAQKIVGQFSTSSFGTAREIQLAGHNFNTPDIARDERLPQAERDAMLALGFQSCLAVPLFKHDRWVANLAVYHDRPHVWTGDEARILDEAADRTWTAVRRAIAEEALRRSEEKYRSLFENVNDGFCIIEMLYDNGQPIDYRFLEANPAFEAQSGLTQAIGKTARDFAPNLEAEFLTNYERVLTTGEPIEFEIHTADLDRYFRVSAYRHGDPQNKQLALVFTNITDRKRREANLAFLAQIAEDSSRLASEEAIMKSTGERLATHLRLDGFNFSYVDERHELVTIKYSWNAADVPQLLGTFRFAEYMTEESTRTMRAGETWVVCDTQHDERTDAQATAAIGVGAVIIVPYHRRGEWQGCLTVTCREVREWTADEIALIGEVSNRTFPRLERARAEDALRDSEVKYRSLFTSIDEGYALCEVMYDGNERPVDVRYLEVNPAFEQLTGLENVAGKTIVELLPSVESFWIETCDRVAQTGVATRHEDCVEGLNRWFDVYFSRVGGEGSRQVAVVFNDITDRKRSEEQLRRAAEMDAFRVKLSDALRSLSDAVEIQATVTRITMNFFGADRCYYCEIIDGSAIIRRDASQADLPSVVGAYPLENSPIFRTMLDAGQPFVFEDVHTTNVLDGNLRQTCLQLQIIASLMVPAIKQGEPVGILCITQTTPRNWTEFEMDLVEEIADRTWATIERARVEAHLREAELQRVREQSAREQEQQRAEALAELDRAKTLFFSNVSHEFRTPLTLILNPLETALARLNSENDPGVDGDTIAARSPDSLGYLQESLQVAHRNSLRLLKLVNALLDFSRIEADRLQANYEPTDLSTYTAELASVFRSAIERANLQLIVDCPPLPETIYVDREMWEKIVLNLLSNAFKFTFEGTISVSLKPQANSVELVELTVSDTGTGIPAAELPRLFDRFYQVKGAKGRSYEGSGIGLSLVQELVKRHGGSIAVASTVGEGTSFTVTIPTGTAHLAGDRIGVASGRATTTVTANAFVEEALRWQPEFGHGAWGIGHGAWGIGQGEHRSLNSGNSPTALLSPSPARILLVDDNADMRDYLRRLLGDRYEVTAVADGAAALAAARQSPPDLVLADVMMPEMDGFELLRSLRTDPQTQTIPIVLLSARAGEASRVEGLEMGADDYLIKPFSARELLARVDAHLQLAQMRREAIYRERVMQEVQMLNDRLEQQVKARTAQLEAVNEELEAFASAIAHDLRTPLRYINNFADRLRGKLEAAQVDASSLKSLDIIAQSALGAEKMVGDLLEFSRLGKTKMLLTTVIMDGLVQQVRSQLQPEPIARSLHWQIDPLPSVEGDPVLLQIVLQNLLSNAIKYTSHRERAEIAIGSIDREAEVIFFVRDNGAGFDMKYCDRLFTMFQRLHSQDEFAGTGVGLATVRRIVHRHGGRIWAESAIDSGATFYFSLPKREVGA
jgi:PAS domain S-box-containing protein